VSGDNNLTEDQARTKWCPMVRQAGIYNDVTPNRSGFRATSGIDQGYAWNKCVASDCMMWQSVLDKGYCGLARR